jgi:hypothetical protein
MCATINEYSTEDQNIHTLKMSYSKDCTLVFYFCLFVCSLFNGSVSNSDCQNIILWIIMLDYVYIYIYIHNCFTFVRVYPPFPFLYRPKCWRPVPPPVNAGSAFSTGISMTFGSITDIFYFVLSRSAVS